MKPIAARILGAAASVSIAPMRGWWGGYTRGVAVMTIVLAAGCGSAGRAGSVPLGGPGGTTGTAAGGAAGRTASPPWQSGARLRAEIIDGGDGAAHFISWWDTVADGPCAFATTPAGVLCLPPATNFYATQYFTDTECTQSLWVVEGTAATAGSYAEFPENECDTTALPARRALGVIGSDLDGQSLWQMGGAGPDLPCAPVVGDRVRHRVDPVGAEPFVSGTVTIGDAAPGGLGAVSIDGQDGSHENAGFFDPGRQVFCGLSAGRFGADGLCLPASSVFGLGRFFADTVCHKETMLIGGLCAGSTYGVQFPRLDQCAAGSLPRAVRIVQLDPALLAPAAGLTILSPTSGTCGAYTGLPLSAAVFQSVLSDYPLSAFPVAAQVRLGTGRLVAQLHTAGDGSVVHESPSPFGVVPSSYRFWDTLLNVECAPRQTADGMLRCLPSSACSSGSEFTNSTCTAIGASVDADPTCDSAQYEIDPCDDTVPATAISALGPPQTSYYYPLQVGGCTQSIPSTGTSAIAAPTPIPFETFAPLTDHIE